MVKLFFNYEYIELLVPKSLVVILFINLLVSLQNVNSKSLLISLKSSEKKADDKSSIILTSTTAYDFDSYLDYKNKLKKIVSSHDLYEEEENDIYNDPSDFKLDLSIGPKKKILKRTTYPRKIISPKAANISSSPSIHASNY